MINPSMRQASLKAGLFVCLLVFLASAGSARAHMFWVETGEGAAESLLTVNIGFSDEFALEEFSKDDEHFKPPFPTLFGAEGEIPLKALGQPSYAYQSQSPLKEGSYQAFVALEPLELGPPSGPKNTYVISAKHITPYVTSSPFSLQSGLSGSLLELVPLEDVSKAKAGGKFPVKVIFEGKPLARAEVRGEFRGFAPEGVSTEPKAFYCQADKEGLIDFVPVKGGFWILETKHEVPNPENSPTKKTVYVSTLTFEVAE